MKKPSKVVVVESSRKLSAAERKELKHDMAVIKKGLDTVFAVAEALLNIKRKELYRETHDSFLAFCRDVLEMSRSHAYRLIDTAQAREEIASIDGIMMPTKESHLRPLLALPAAEIPKVWKSFVKEVNGCGIKLKHVEEFVASYRRKSEGEQRPLEGWKASVVKSISKLKQLMDQEDCTEMLAEIERMKLMIEHVGRFKIGNDHHEREQA